MDVEPPGESDSTFDVTAFQAEASPRRTKKFAGGSAPPIVCDAALESKKTTPIRSFDHSPVGFGRSMVHPCADERLQRRFQDLVLRRAAAGVRREPGHAARLVEHQRHVERMTAAG